MRYSVEAAANEARADFIEAKNAAVEEGVSKIRAKSELRRSREVHEATRVDEENNHRRRFQEEEENSSSVQSSVADKLLAAAAEKSKGKRMRAIAEMIASMNVIKDRNMEEAVERMIEECGE